jgi:hypothetical protein
MKPEVGNQKQAAQGIVAENRRIRSRGIIARGGKKIE